MTLTADQETLEHAVKIEQRRWEPWKALSAAFGPGVVVTTALFALIGWIVSHLLG